EDLMRHVAIAQELGQRDPARRAALAAEAFEIGQLAHDTATGGAVANMAARFAAGSDALATLVRARQDALAERRDLGGQLLDALGKPSNERDADAEAGLRRRILASDQQVDALEARLAREFPSYAELSQPRPMTLDETRQLLHDDELLVVFGLSKSA